MTTQNRAKALSKPVESHEKDDLKTVLKSNTNSEGKLVQKGTPNGAQKESKITSKTLPIFDHILLGFSAPLGSAPAEIPNAPAGIPG